MSESSTPSIETRGNALIARAEVKLLDDQQLKLLSPAIDETVASNSDISLIVLELSRVQLMPSLAIGLLVQLSNKCKARQQKLKLAGVSPQVRQVFAVTRLDRVFEFAESVDDAVA